MPSLINLKFPNSESTLTSPFRFFTEMVKHDIIGLAKKSFQNELPKSTEDDPFNKFAYTIEKDKLSFTIEYSSDDNAGYVDEFGNWVNMPSNEILYKTITFKSELNKFLYSEFRNSKELIINKWDKKGVNNDTNVWFKNAIKQLSNCIDRCKSLNSVTEYLDVIVNPYEALIRLFYDEYPLYVPNPNFNQKIFDILHNSNQQQSIYKPKVLSTNIYRKIVELTCDDTTSLFGFEDNQTTIKNFFSFGAKAFELITEPILFNKNIEAAYYLISQLLDYNGIKVKEILATQIFSFAGNPFSTTAYYKNISTIKNSKQTLRGRIDLIIDSSLS